MKWVSCDVEADGPIPGDFSMIALGAVLVGDMSKTFYATLRPISDKWVPEALAVSGFSREQTTTFASPLTMMNTFASWLASHCDGQPIMIADNNGFDWQFVNWYFHHFVGRNPFGFSSRNLNDIFHGLAGDMRASFKHLRKTKHDHNPVNDAMGNAEALIAMRDTMGLKINL